MRSLSLPIMIAAMGAYHMLRDEEAMYDKSAAMMAEFDGQLSKQAGKT